MRITILSITLSLCTVAGHSTTIASDVEVFIVAGQSNTVGYGTDIAKLPPALHAPQNDVLFWYEEGPSNAVNNPALRIHSNGWIPLQYQSDPNQLTFGPGIDGFGPEIKLGRVLADRVSEDVALVKFAFNGTSLEKDWSATKPGPLYVDLKKAVADAMAALATMGHQGELAGFFWMQGETDAHYVPGGWPDKYEKNLTDFINQVRTDFAAPDLPFILGRLHSEFWKSGYITKISLEKVRLAQEKVADILPGVAMVDTDNSELQADWIHFSAPGQLLLGQFFATAHLAMACDSPMNMTDIDTLDLYAGDVVWHMVTGDPGALYIVFLSFGGGPVASPWGVMGLDFPVYFLWTENLNVDGHQMVPIELLDTGLGFMTFYTHAIVNANPPVWAAGGNNPNGSGSIKWGLH